MTLLRESLSQPNSSGWPERCAYWISESEPKISRRRREREKNPLILTGHGLSIRVEKGTLLIKDGHTHYPAEQREWRFFKGSLDIPPVIVVVDGSGEITMDGKHSDNHVRGGVWDSG